MNGTGIVFLCFSMFSLLICHSTSLARKPIVFDAWLVLRLPQAFQHFPD